jgi:ABC-type nickel/cobalt efflux system permease component RcnA
MEIFVFDFELSQILMAFFSEKQKKVSKSMMLLFLSVSVQGLYAGFVFTNAPRGLLQKKEREWKTTDQNHQCTSTLSYIT